MQTVQNKFFGLATELPMNTAIGIMFIIFLEKSPEVTNKYLYPKDSFNGNWKSFSQKENNRIFSDLVPHFDALIGVS